MSRDHSAEREAGKLSFNSYCPVAVTGRGEMDLKNTLDQSVQVSGFRVIMALLVEEKIEIDILQEKSR